MTETVKKTTKTVKAPAKKAVAKATKTSVAGRPEVAEATERTPKTQQKVEVKNTGLTIDVLGTDGKVVESMTLPEAFFGAKLNKTLIAQAVRVYLANQRRDTASTKTRGEVDGSTRKIYQQKGTGRARHGGIRAPIFVKGGIAHGRKKEANHELDMSKKMRVAAFASALSSRLNDGAITVVSGISSLDKKTKVFAGMFEKLSFVTKGRNALLVLPKHNEDIYKSARNLSGVEVTTAAQLNTYQVLAHKRLIFMKEAVDALGIKNKV
jgi:large subunit ribosomal protein L4